MYDLESPKIVCMAKVKLKQKNTRNKFMMPIKESIA